MDKSLLEKIEALPDAKMGGAGRREFTPEEDEILLRFWKVKRKEDISKLLGVSENTARKRWEELTAAN